MSTNAFDDLALAADKKKVEIVLTMHRRGKGAYLRIEARSQKKIIDFADIKKSERVEEVAARMHERLRRDKVIQ